MKLILKVLTFIWFAFWLTLGISILIDTPEQIEKDRIFIKTKIKPSVDFVYNFKMKNNRLPNYREFYTWERNFYNDYSSDLNQKEDSLIADGLKMYVRKQSDLGLDGKKFENIDWNKNFAIAVWRGEWTEYYYSWTDTYDTNNYSWKSSIWGFVIYQIVGLLPLIFWKRRKNEK